MVSQWDGLLNSATRGVGIINHVQYFCQKSGMSFRALHRAAVVRVSFHSKGILKFHCQRMLAPLYSIHHLLEQPFG
jgi:hypothetical protein